MLGMTEEDIARAQHARVESRPTIPPQHRHMHPVFPSGSMPMQQHAYSTAHSFSLPHMTGLPSVGVPSVGVPGAAPQQYWLLQGPNGERSILLSTNPPPNPNNPFLFSPPRMRSPLAPIGTHLSPPPGLNLNDGSAAGPPNAEMRRRVDYFEREAALRAEINAMHQRNVERMATLDENRRQILQLHEQARRIRAQPAPAPAPAPGAAPPAQNQRQARRNRFHNFLDMLLWSVGWANPHAPVPTAAAIEETLRWITSIVWLAGRLIFAVYLLGGGRDLRRDAFLWITAGVIFSE